MRRDDPQPQITDADGAVWIDARYDGGCMPEAAFRVIDATRPPNRRSPPAGADGDGGGVQAGQEPRLTTRIAILTKTNRKLTADFESIFGRLIFGLASLIFSGVPQ